jgi:hypothetical protein
MEIAPMEIDTSDDEPDQLAWLYAAAESLRLFNHVTVCGHVNPGVVHGGLGALAVTARRMSQAFERVVAALRHSYTGTGLDTAEDDLAAAKQAAVAMHEALCAAHSNLFELIWGNLPRLPGFDSPPPSSWPSTS